MVDQNPQNTSLYLLQYLFLELSLDFLTLLICVWLAVEVKEGTEVELGSFQKLDLSDVDLESYK